MRWLVLGVGLALAACRKDAPDPYAEAKARHLALVTKGERPDSKAFDEVLVLLDAVPASSPKFVDAKQLKAAIENVRVHPRRPLAKVHADDGDLPEDIKAQTRACAGLAVLLARDGGATPAVVKALDDCRRRIEKLDRQYHDAHEPPVDDLSQRLDALLDAGVR
ncbi:MAG: hypothetical protein Q8L14_32025 [Myxococcales bacterium]|nr:hypothetical protein [Myxococcales bacterium]